MLVCNSLFFMVFAWTALFCGSPLYAANAAASNSAVLNTNGNSAPIINTNASSASMLNTNSTNASPLNTNVQSASPLNTTVTGASPLNTNTDKSSPLSATSLSPKSCEAITEATPEANVAYQSGVDASGHAIAPADVPGQPQIQMPKTLTIPLTIGLANAINLPTSTYPYNQLGEGTEALIGTLTVTGNHVLFNGQPLSDEQQSNLSVLCMKANAK